MSKLEINIEQSAIIHSLKETLGCGTHEIDYTVKALKARDTPKKLALTDFRGIFKCRCGNIIYNRDDNFCSKCGQRIDWDE